MHNQNLSRSDARQRSQLITVQDYQVHLDLTGAPHEAQLTYPVTCTIRFECSSPGASTFLDYLGENVESITLNGTTLDAAEQVNGARIELPRLEASNEVTVTANSRYSRSGEGLHRFFDPADGQCYLYTQYEPADSRRVFPNFEQPDLKASFTFAVTAPADWVVASNTKRLSWRRTGETSTWTFKPTERISTYITTILAGPYFQVRDEWTETVPDGRGGTTELTVPFGLYCRSSIAEHFDHEAIFALTKAGLSYFHTLFEYPYPFGKYDQAFVPEYNLGAMENPGLVTFTESYIFTSAATRLQYSARANTIMHEMAHMWFGDLVTMKWWDDLWLKESFAEYMGTLASAEATEFTEAWVNFANRRKLWAYQQDSLPTTHPIVADITDLDAAKQNFDGITYAKGASVLKQLVAYVGFDSFIDAARSYFREHAFGNTTLNDFLDALERASGRDMRAWSAAWLETSGVPELRAELSGDAGQIGSATMVQDAADSVTGVRGARPQRFTLGIFDYDDDASLVATGTFDVDAQTEETVVAELAHQPRPALLVPNVGDETYARVSFDEQSLNTLLSNLKDVRDPLAQAVSLAALWTMTRDAKLPAAAYIQAVMRYAPTAKYSSVLETVLANVYFALTHYLGEDARPEMARQVFDTAEVEQERAPEQTRLIWTRFMIRVAALVSASADGLQRALAAGELGSQTLDDDLRWRILRTLSALGALERDQLETARRADRTASGHVGYLRAVSAENSGAAKQDAFERVSGADALSNDEVSALIDGFTDGSSALLDPFVPEYFTGLEAFWAENSIEIAQRLVRGLYPSWQGPDTEASIDAVTLTERWLADHPDAPAALTRVLREEAFLLGQSRAAQRLSNV
ncbi:aminopeptidase N [Haematomicrobium sanguinis]|uniref:aminopeptidase N n=1 Tax=Haematomicrobium sanguinis TaxID=479106 RepID=UPI00047CA5B3|nr:aminopeptidase N [Haematomicrobium sanguinis]